MALVNGVLHDTVEPWRHVQLQLPEISELINTLNYGLQLYFEDVEVTYTECPNLTTPPYNLAAKGLHGTQTIVGLTTVNEVRQNEALWDLGEYMDLCALRDQNPAIPLYQRNSSFLIGGGYTRTPVHPSNGILIMNATYTAPDHYNNESCIVFKDTNSDRIKMETLNDPGHMMCSVGGNFFLSKGEEGNIIKIRVKKRRNHRLQNNIINLLRTFLSIVDHNSTLDIGLGGVLMVKKGNVTHKVLPNIPEIQPIRTLDRFDEFYETVDSQVNGEPFLISLGTIATSNNSLLRNVRHNFYTFSNNENGGLFVTNRLSDDDIEYVGYFNIAKSINLPPPLYTRYRY